MNVFTDYLIHLRDTGRDQQTINWYRHKFIVFLEWAVGHGYAHKRLTRQIMNEFFTYLALDRGLSSYTVHNYWKTLKVICAWSLENGYAKYDPMKDIPEPKTSKPPARIFTPDEIHKILDALDRRKSKNNNRDRAWILLDYDTGLRRETLRGIRIKAVDLPNHEIRLWDVKSKKEHIVAFGDKTAEAIRKHLETQTPKSEYLFQNGSGNAMSGYRMWYIINDLCTRSGIPRRKLHYMRDTYGCEGLLHGMDTTAIQDSMGHTTPAMTQKYQLVVRGQHYLAQMKAKAPGDRL